MLSSELETLTSRSNSIAIVVPYRNREAHLATFLPYMKQFLNIDETRMDIVILIVEQADNLPFNRGWLLNVGSHIVTRKSGLLSSFMSEPARTLVLHDVDMLPVEKELRSFYERTPPLGSSFHMLNPFQYEQFDHMYQIYGGINVFRSENFLKDLNGYPNNRHGWGLEDCMLRQRASLINLKTIRPWKGKYRNLPHESHRNDEILMQQMTLLSHDFMTMRENGISNTKYSINGDIRSFDDFPRTYLVKVSRVVDDSYNYHGGGGGHDGSVSGKVEF